MHTSYVIQHYDNRRLRNFPILFNSESIQVLVFYLASQNTFLI